MQAINMIEHQDEIYARPARTWFQVRSMCSCQMHQFLIVIEINYVISLDRLGRKRQHWQNGRNLLVKLLGVEVPSSQ